MVNYICKVLLATWGDFFFPFPAAEPEKGGDFVSTEHRLCSEMEHGSWNVALVTRWDEMVSAFVLPHEWI